MTRLATTYQPRFYGGTYGRMGIQAGLEGIRARQSMPPASTVPQNERNGCEKSDAFEGIPKFESPPPIVVGSDQASSEDAAVIQIWEGTVLWVEAKGSEFRAALHATLGQIPDHVATVDCEWVNDQDKDLVKPGAVFYLTLYKNRKRGGTISNAQELRFRRLPNWTGAQIEALKLFGKKVASDIKAKPIAVD